MNNRTILKGSAALDIRGDIVEVWRQAVLGDAAARRALLRRIMPASLVDVSPAIIDIDVLAARRRPDRAAA
ncbi:MAG TPA: hypothetical protein VKE41_16840 [Roseiflexaceae bacterium]|nr:hypothetical protein [Roseiflexaceae bacterium]